MYNSLILIVLISVRLTSTRPLNTIILVVAGQQQQKYIFLCKVSIMHYFKVLYLITEIDTLLLA